MHGLVALALAVAFAAEVGVTTPSTADVRAGLLFADRHAVLVGLSGAWADGTASAGGEGLFREYLRPLEFRRLSPLLQLALFGSTTPSPLPSFGADRTTRFGIATGFGGEVLLFTHFGIAAIAGVRFARVERVICADFFGCSTTAHAEVDVWSTVLLTFHL